MFDRLCEQLHDVSYDWDARQLLESLTELSTCATIGSLRNSFLTSEAEACDC